MPPTRLIGLGVFVGGGLLLFALGLFLIGDRRLLFSAQFAVHAEFEEIAGLQDGAPVRVSGMDAGEVTEIAIPASPTGRFRVRMRLRQDLQPLVRTDSVASIRTDGLVGGRYVHIDAGSEQAPAAADGGSIDSREPFDFADLLAQGTTTLENANRTITELRGHLDEVVGVINQTAANANALVASVSTDLTAISQAGRRMSEDTARIVADIRAGRGTVGKLITDDELYQRVTGIATEAELAAKGARAAADAARKAIEGLQGGLSSDGAVPSVIGELRQTLASTRDAMSNLAENTEALKRNVLFRGYFRDRGYYDLDAITPSAYRDGALAGEHREAIRIWLRADRLFRAVSAGPGVASGTRAIDTVAAVDSETLSPEGRVRLDRAMAEVLRYPSDSPLIVESYADEPTRDARFRRAVDRGRQVRDYVLARYGLVPARIGAMPLGDVAIGSPNGATWDGVALTVWVDRRVLRGEPRP